MDVIILWDVLEHMPSPRFTLYRKHDLFRPDGLVFFSIPNLDRIERKLLKTEQIGWNASHHYALSNNTTIQR
jgi:2-polyprenyl-3-methyl-5-hydroxy-6-metoxy-1,4-benzoquinol methylase